MRRLIVLPACLAVALGACTADPPAGAPAGSGGSAAAGSGPSGAAGDPAATGRAFLEAWAAGDTTAAAVVTDDPPAARERLDETEEGLRQEKLALVPGELTTDSGTSLPFRATATLGTLGDWSYDGVVPLVQTGGRWVVDWSPSVIHPELTKDNRLVRRRTLPPRAPVLDRKGRALMAPRAVVEVGLEPRRVTNLPAALRLAARMGRDAAKLRAALKAADPDELVPVITLRREEYAKFAKAVRATPGFVATAGTKTLGPSQDFARALLGRVSPATAETLADAGPTASSLDDVGSSGLQRAFQRQLAGTPGGEVRLVDRQGDSQLGVLHRFRGKPGTALRTTLDLDAQRAAEKALGTVEGTKVSMLVAVQPSTGGVLAAANSEVSAQNRAFTGSYPPGSTFKVVTTAALLARGLTPERTVPCPREVVVSGKRFDNQDGFVLGRVPFRTDFARSCNTAFIGLARGLPEGALEEQAAAFGLGAQWDIGVPAFSGSVDTSGDEVVRAAAAIGQGKVLVSPLAMATVAAAVQSGSVRAPLLLPGRGRAPAPRPLADADTLRSLMRSVVTEGSARATLGPVPGVPGAKTGTAEYGDASPPRTHAWIIGYRGDLAYAVLVEDGGSGGSDAAPVARAFLDALG